MRYIAIMNTLDMDCYECGGMSIILSVTDWTEVSDEDFELLSKASQKSLHYNSKMTPFKILERPNPEDVNSVILKSIDDYKALIAKEAEKAAKAKAAAEKAKKRRDAEKELKTKAQKEARAEKLRKELAELEA